MGVRIRLRDLNDQSASCGVLGCSDLVLFWCETTEEWVCYLHGFLTLRREWNKQEARSLEVRGELAVPQTKEDR